MAIASWKKLDKKTRVYKLDQTLLDGSFKGTSRAPNLSGRSQVPDGANPRIGVHTSVEKLWAEMRRIKRRKRPLKLELYTPPVQVHM